MRWLFLTLVLCGCAADPHALTYVHRDAPHGWFAAREGNELTTPPTRPENVGPQASR